MRTPLKTTPGLAVVELLGLVKPAQLPEAFPSSDTASVGRLKVEVSIAEAGQRAGGGFPAGSVSNLQVRRGEERVFTLGIRQLND